MKKTYRFIFLRIVYQHDVLMDSFVTALKSGLGTEYLIPNLEELTTKKDYSPSGQRISSPPDPRHKLPTRLSGKPTEFEKELRNLVLTLYSDQTQEKSSMSHPAEGQVSPHADDVISGRMKELLSSLHAKPVSTGKTGTKEGVSGAQDLPGLFQSFHYDDTGNAVRFINSCCQLRKFL